MQIIYKREHLTFSCLSLKSLLQMEHPRVSRKIKLILLIGAIIETAVEGFSYNPSGWRPSGSSFSLQKRKSRYNYDIPSLLYELSSSNMTPSSTIMPSIVNIKMETTISTTTPRSKEPTTPSNIDNEDTQINPAFAIANSFAFNKPVYIYSSFSFRPSFTYTQ